MAYTVMFMVHKIDMASNHLAPLFASYDWWVDLVQKALETADESEMRLWPDDGEGIVSGQELGARVPNDDTGDIDLRGQLTPAAKQEILTNYLTEEGYIKWFTLILRKDGEVIFASEHYGDETCVFVSSEEQVADIQEWAKGYPIIWRVDVFAG